MLIKYSLGRYYEGRFEFRINFEFNKYKNKKITKYRYDDFVLVDLINCYKEYKFIQNLNSKDNNYLYYTAVTKYRNTEKNQMINIGDVKKIKKSQHINFSNKEIFVYDILFKLSTQWEYDRYQFILNRKNSNSKLYSFIYKNTLDYFKEKHDSKKKIKESVV